MFYSYRTLGHNEKIDTHIHFRWDISIWRRDGSRKTFQNRFKKFSILDFRNYLPLNKKNKIDSLFEFVYSQISFVHFNLKIALWSIWITTIFENADGSREKLFGKRRPKFFSLLCEHGLWSWSASIFFWMLNHLWRRICNSKTRPSRVDYSTEGLCNTNFSDSFFREFQKKVQIW